MNLCKLWLYNHRTAQVERDLVQTCTGMGAYGRSSSTLSHCIWKTSSKEDCTTSLGRLFQWMVLCTIKKSFLMSRRNHSWCKFTCGSLTFPCGSSWEERFYPLCSHTLNTGILWWDRLWVIFPQIKRLNSSHLSSQGRFYSLFFILMTLLWTSFHQSLSFFELWGPELDTVLQMWPDKQYVELDNQISTSLLVMTL